MKLNAEIGEPRFIGFRVPTVVIFAITLKTPFLRAVTGRNVRGLSGAAEMVLSRRALPEDLQRLKVKRCCRPGLSSDRMVFKVPIDRSRLQLVFLC